MGKMKMGSDIRNKTELKQTFNSQSIEPSVSKQDFELTMKAVLERHSDLFKRLVILENEEKNVPLVTMPPNPCLCEKPQNLPKKNDFWARKHSLLLKNEFLKDRKELDSLLGMFAKSNNQKMVEIDQKLVKLEDKIDMYLDLIPEEIQIVKEYTIEKPVTDKKLVIGLAISIILNIIVLIIK